MAGYSCRDKASSMIAERMGDHSTTRGWRIIHAMARDIQDAIEAFVVAVQSRAV
jgi:hypothetical protein